MSNNDHSEAFRKKQHEAAALSPAEETQLQEQLASYHQIAEALEASQNTAAIEEALAPITALDETVQIALLKALGKEQNVDAADVAQALHTMSAQKEIRKEARRTLLRLESANIYAEDRKSTRLNSSHVE